jgi:uncharacterized protein (TIGR02246 family)
MAACAANHEPSLNHCTDVQNAAPLRGEGVIHMHRIVFVVAAVAVATVFGPSMATAAATQSPADPALAAVRAAIDAGNASFLKALEAGDGIAYAALFAPDGVELQSGGGGATVGRAAIQADEAAGAKESKITGGTIHTTMVHLDGGLAYETGTYSFDVLRPDKPAHTTYGRYFEIWEKQSDGTWLIKVDCGYPDKYDR